MDYIDLTDEEILEAIKYSRLKAKINGIPFKDCLVDTLDLLKDDKEKGDISSNITFSPKKEDDRYDFSTPFNSFPGIEGFKDENKQLVDLQEYVERLSGHKDQFINLEEYVKKLDEQIMEAKDRAAKWLGRYNARVINSITGATDEQIVDERREHQRLFEEVVSGKYNHSELQKELNSRSYTADKDYQHALLEVSTLQRKKYYAICKLCDDKVLLFNHLWLINEYNPLYNLLIETQLEAERRGSLSSFRSANPSTKYFLEGLENARNHSKVGFVISDTQVFGMWPSSFQSVFAYLNDVVIDLRNSMEYNKEYVPNLETIKVIKDTLEEEISNEKRYSFSEYREHLIEQIHLTDTEREMFDDHLEKELDLEVIKAKNI